MKTQNAHIEEVYALVEFLLSNGLTEYDIAKAGGMSRQAINFRRNNREKGSTTAHLGFGFSVLKAAADQGLLAEVNKVLTGQTGAQVTSVQVAICYYPDLRSEELALIERGEELLKMKPLPPAIIKELICASRTPKS